MNTLTCVYCGAAYPEGTPPHGSKVLTDHIKVCKSHPLRAAELRISELRSALCALVGSSDTEELKSMAKVIISSPAPDEDKAAMINAINVLIDQPV